MSEMSTWGGVGGGSGKVNDVAGKCGWRKLTMTEHVILPGGKINNGMNFGFSRNAGKRSCCSMEDLL